MNKKNITKNKARLVVQGYNQEEGVEYDETFAHAARIEAIRMLIASAAQMKFTLYQMDVKSAFLNGYLKEEVIVKQPLRFESEEFPDYVFKLDKTLYGLKQAPRAWLLGGYSDILKEKHFRNNTFSWFMSGVLGTKKQNSVALSAAEVEYVAATSCCAQLLQIRQQLRNYGIFVGCVPIFCDNTSTIKIAKNLCQHNRTKHVDIRHQFLRDNIEKGNISINFCKTEDQIANNFTKALSVDHFERNRLELGLINTSN
ncbi:uncharacterized protein LOC142163839 [Nicotiana tabacum]|uniref:Uncharacterized protein LOC142163839 n=1 Tax=Nicotiana tabacum TaxID=4097 RepID=A0AC58RWG7_TOBAC